MKTTAHRIGGLVATALLLGAVFGPAPGASGADKVTSKDLVDFKVTVLKEDPFSPMNQVGAAKREFQRGEVIRVVITGVPKAGNHTYPITQRTEKQAENGLSRLRFEPDPAFKPLAPLFESTPEFADTQTDEGVVLELDRPFTWSQDVLITPDAKVGAQVLRFKLTFRVCDEHRCLPPETVPFEIPLEIAAQPAIPGTPELDARLTAKEPAIKVVPVPAGFKTSAPPPSAAPPAQLPSMPKLGSGLFGLILTSMAAAVAMLFTPCVFPMIPITVSFFLKQSEKKHHNALLSAGVYSLTIIIVLTLAVMILGKFIVSLANNPWVNLGLGAVLIFFALSLFGMYEIELPSFLAQFTSSREQKGGHAGTFFMALTFTITSFTCTGPFLGPLLVGAKEYQLGTGELLVASLAYSATFAAPFFVLALFPRLLKALPKSGGWLNSVKVVMGFLELAAALKFLGNTDISLNPGNPLFFNYETVLCAWIALSAACGLYLLGVYRLPHDSPVESIGVPRMLLAVLFLGLSLYLAPAMWREQPAGVVGDWAVAFLPLDTKERPAGGARGGEAHLDWHSDYEKAWAEAVKENKLIFIDFTGVNCTNCRENEKRVFPRPDVRKALEKYVRVQLYNDFVPKRGLTSEQAQQEAALNQKWQSATFGDLSTPLYVIFRPAKDRPFDGDKLNGEVLYKIGGKIGDNQIASFTQNLEAPLSGQFAQAKSAP